MQSICLQAERREYTQATRKKFLIKNQIDKPVNKPTNNIINNASNKQSVKNFSQLKTIIYPTIILLLLFLPFLLKNPILDWYLEKKISSFLASPVSIHKLSLQLSRPSSISIENMYIGNTEQALKTGNINITFNLQELFVSRQLIIHSLSVAAIKFPPNKNSTPYIHTTAKQQTANQQNSNNPNDTYSLYDLMNIDISHFLQSQFFPTNTLLQIDDFAQTIEKFHLSKTTALKKIASDLSVLQKNYNSALRNTKIASTVQDTQKAAREIPNLIAKSQALAQELENINFYLKRYQTQLTSYQENLPQYATADSSDIIQNNITPKLFAHNVSRLILSQHFTNSIDGFHAVFLPILARFKGEFLAHTPFSINNITLDFGLASNPLLRATVSSVVSRNFVDPEAETSLTMTRNAKTTSHSSARAGANNDEKTGTNGTNDTNNAPSTFDFRVYAPHNNFDFIGNGTVFLTQDAPHILSFSANYLNIPFFSNSYLFNAVDIESITGFASGTMSIQYPQSSNKNLDPIINANISIALQSTQPFYQTPYGERLAYALLSDAPTKSTQADNTKDEKTDTTNNSTIQTNSQTNKQTINQTTDQNAAQTENKNSTPNAETALHSTQAIQITIFTPLVFDNTTTEGSAKNTTNVNTPIRTAKTNNSNNTTNTNTSITNTSSTNISTLIHTLNTATENISEDKMYISGLAENTQEPETNKSLAPVLTNPAPIQITSNFSSTYPESIDLLSTMIAEQLEKFSAELQEKIITEIKSRTTNTLDQDKQYLTELQTQFDSQFEKHRVLSDKYNVLFSEVNHRITSSIKNQTRTRISNAIKNAIPNPGALAKENIKKQIKPFTNPPNNSSNNQKTE